MLNGIRELDMIAAGRPLTEDERLRKEDFYRELERIILLQEVSWRQKSKAFLSSEGDKNTKFFQEVDGMVWTSSSCHGFVVKSYYAILQSGDHSSFPWRSI
jgi:hypothetical protein